MLIDMYTHIVTPKYEDAISKYLPKVKQRIKTLVNLEQRFQIMDKFDDYKQVLTHNLPPIEAITKSKDAVEICCLGNDELAEIISRYPDRFVGGAANLPMNDIEAALKEADRAIKCLGLKGVQIYTNINGKPLDSPEFMPLYERMAHYDLPIWIHPHRELTVAEYSTESESKYNLFAAIGWPYETQVAICRLACSGVLDGYPNIKFITHHCGGGIPYFANRLGQFLSQSYVEHYPRTTLPNFIKEPIEYLRMFYGDTAINEYTPALQCGCAFFGAEHIVFGTDMPYGGEYRVRQAISSVMELVITDSDKQKIFEGNAKNLLHL